MGMWISNCNIKDLKVFSDAVVILSEHMSLLTHCRCFKSSVTRKSRKLESREHVVNAKEPGMIVHHKYITNNDELCTRCADVRPSFLVCSSRALLIRLNDDALSRTNWSPRKPHGWLKNIFILACRLFDFRPNSAASCGDKTIRSF